MRSWVVLALFILLLTCAPSASAQQTSDGLTKDTTLRVMELVLPSEHLLGSWDDLRSKLEDAGITPRLVQITDVAGNPSGGLTQGATQASGTELSLLFDLEKTSGLKGGSVFASFSQRWGTSLSLKYIDNVFGTQQIYGFETFRVIDVSYQQKLFDDRVELRLGRFATTDDFYVSPYYVGFISNAFCGNPIGILLDAPGMTAYTGTWAALAKVEPTKRSYVMAAVYNGDPTIRSNKYHGVNLSLKGPPFVIGELGYQINGLEGDTQRLGNYKLGAWYDNSELTNFESGVKTRGSWGFYGLFDQVLVPIGTAGSNRGFGIFGSVTVAMDSSVQPMPLNLAAGFSARGLFDARQRDVVSFGVGSGEFSEELEQAQREGLLPGRAGGVQDSETVIELTYRFDLRQGAFFIQPDFQYIIQPGGTSRLNNAPVFASQFGINF